MDNRTKICNYVHILRLRWRNTYLFSPKDLRDILLTMEYSDLYAELLMQMLGQMLG